MDALDVIDMLNLPGFVDGEALIVAHKNAASRLLFDEVMKGIRGAMNLGGDFVVNVFEPPMFEFEDGRLTSVVNGSLVITEPIHPLGTSDNSIHQLIVSPDGRKRPSTIFIPYQPQIHGNKLLTI